MSGEAWHPLFGKEKAMKLDNLVDRFQQAKDLVKGLRDTMFIWKQQSRIRGELLIRYV